MAEAEAPKDFTEDFVVEDAAPANQGQSAARETDAHRLAQRQKQIDLGKNTLGYQRYRQAVPKDKRDRRRDPWTPDIHKACSKRAFDGQIKKWRRMLHEWDPQEGAEASNPEAVAPERAAALPELEGSYELVSHGDAAQQQDKGQKRRKDDRSSSSPRPGSKNGRAMRQVTNQRLPLKMPSAMRGGGGQKRSLEQAAQGSEAAWEDQRSGSSKQPTPTRGAARQKQQRNAAAELAAAAQGKKAAPPRSAPAAQTGLPEVDWGEDSDDDGGWQLVGQPVGATIPAGFTSVYTNWAAAEEDDEIDVAI